MMNQLSRPFVLNLSVILCLVTLTAVAPAQSSAQISGRVADKRGDAIGAARVTAVAGSQTSGETKTDDSGRFTLGLPPGDYELRVSADGFSAFRQRVSLNSQQETVNITLEPATVA